MKLIRLLGVQHSLMERGEGVRERRRRTKEEGRTMKKDEMEGGGRREGRWGRRKGRRDGEEEKLNC